MTQEELDIFGPLSGDVVTDQEKDDAFTALHQSFVKQTQSIRTSAPAFIAPSIIPPDAPPNQAVAPEAPKRRGRPPKVKVEQVPCSICGEPRDPGEECKTLHSPEAIRIVPTVTALQHYPSVLTPEMLAKMLRAMLAVLES